MSVEFFRYGQWSDQSVSQAALNGYCGTDGRLFVKGRDGAYTAYGIRRGVGAFNGMGTLELPFPDGRVISVANVERVVITWDKSKKGFSRQFSFLESRDCDVAPGIDEMPSLHFYVQVRSCSQYQSDGASKLLCFDGAELAETIEGIEGPIRNAADGAVGFSIVDGELWSHYVRNTDGTLDLVGVSHGPAWECEIKRNEALFDLRDKMTAEAIEDGHIRLYFSKGNDMPSRVAVEYLKEHYDPVPVENIFKDDETENYSIDVDIDDVDLISFMLLKGMARPYSIYDIPIDEYLLYVPGKEETEYFFRGSSAMAFHQAVLENALAVSEFSTIADLQWALEGLRNRSGLVQGMVLVNLFDRLVPGSKLNARGEFVCPKLANGKPDLSFLSEQQKRVRSLYNAQKTKMAESGRLNIKWKGEYQMFRIAKSLYRDAVFQYHEDWLGRQSLDVYIPRLNLGIEYQGIQHYEPVEFFGGEDGLRSRKELDQRKRAKCADRGVKLLEWRYDEVLTKKRLEDAIGVICKNA